MLTGWLRTVSSQHLCGSDQTESSGGLATLSYGSRPGQLSARYNLPAVVSAPSKYGGRTVGGCLDEGAALKPGNLSAAWERTCSRGTTMQFRLYADYWNSTSIR